MCMSPRERQCVNVNVLVLVHMCVCVCVLVHVCVCVCERERERRKEELSNLVRALMCCQFGKPEVGQGMERLFDIFGLSWTKKEKRKKERKQSLKIDWKHFCGEDVKTWISF